MSKRIPTRFEPQEFPHPGGIVVEYLEFHNWSQRDLSRRTGLTPKTISAICNGKTPITPTTSLALEKVFQRPAHLWLNLQRQFDEAQARLRARANEVQWREWAKSFPMAELKKRQWLITSSWEKSDAESLLAFFGVASPEGWETVWQAAHVAYRQTRKFKTSVGAISAWVRATELAALDLQVSEFDESAVRGRLEDLRSLTLHRTENTIQPIQEMCASAGIAVVWVPALKHTGISGCARWLTNKKALVALTLRHKTDDQMWFTFLHEIGHLLLHRKTHSFVLDNPAENLSDNEVDPLMRKQEDEANRFAADTLIPPDSMSKFIAGDDFGNDAIKRFADRIGVSPGIVVGRLQHDGILDHFQGNTFKQRLAFQVADD